MSQTVTAIDPGTEQSAILIYEGRVRYAQILHNATLLDMARGNQGFTDLVAIEDIESFGMPVGRETFATVRFIGRLQEALERNGRLTRLIGRRHIKLHLCGTARAKDGNIRQALIDKYGPKGTKKEPGPTFLISSHLWSALAIADYALNNPGSALGNAEGGG